ncbi:methyltransferase domain-containing protein [Thiohalocapsa marina]|uniref:Carboxy-S-adenosyl-L-methionine synthase n=1 Tax=Thiohalocapsa marina TaxID=424902 RepID=A0A5M8FJE3_9GAMM|nr:methyltransferase domain-containing protein [Thiohalocapsa marina]KAA6184624.1 methyltransferase domain-containing protein [Thiohalocapsa marina]
MTQDTRDTLYAGLDAPADGFVFDARVARVFADMLRRSVPGATELVRLTGLVAAHVATTQLKSQPQSQPPIRSRMESPIQSPIRPLRVYDLGCSLGASSASILAHLPPGAPVHIIAVDNAPAMIDGLRERLGDAVADGRVQPRCCDVLELPIAGAHVVVLNLTLQFLPRAQRLALLRRIRRGLEPGGVLILAEKVVWPDQATDAVMAALHARFKRTQGYSALEVSRKRAALERVLVPDDRETHEDRLRAAGFQRVVPFFQCLNFVGWLAWA